MPLDLQAFGQSLASLKPIDVPSALDRYKTLAALKTQQLQQQDIAAQVQERQAMAQKDALAQQKQARMAQILQDATIDPETGMPDMKSPAMQQLYREFPDVHAALSEHYAKVGSEAATAANQRGDLKVKQDNSAETARHNKVEEVPPAERDYQAWRQAANLPDNLFARTQYKVTGQKLTPGEVIAGAPGEPPIASAPAKPDKQTEFEQTLSDFNNNPTLTKKYGIGPIAFDKYKQDQRVQQAAASRPPAPELTSEGLDAAALAFAKTGVLPAMGMGAAASNVRTKIINRAAELNPSLDIASNKADYGANQNSLKALQKQADAVNSFESTALKNTKPLLASAQKIIDTGSPLINMPLRDAAAKLAGSPDQAVFNAALQVVTNEYAKIISNPNMSGQLSDSARQEVEKLIPASATLKQVVAVANLLKTDAENRKSSINEQIQAIQQRIRGGSNNQAPVAAPAGGNLTDKIRARLNLPPK